MRPQDEEFMHACPHTSSIYSGSFLLRAYPVEKVADEETANPVTGRRVNWRVTLRRKGDPVASVALRLAREMGDIVHTVLEAGGRRVLCMS